MSISDIWPLLPLCEVVLNLQQGFARSPNGDNTGIPHLRPNNISSEGMLNLSDIKYVPATKQDLDRYGVQKGDIVFNNTNSIELVGKTTYFDKGSNYLISNHLTRIRTNPEFLQAEFLAFYLHYLWQKGISRCWAKQWVNQAAIDISSLSKFEVPVPDLYEQNYIINILHRANALRGKRYKINERLGEIYSSLFHSTFGNPVTNPKKWEVVPLTLAGSLERGKSQHRPRDAPHLYGGPYPFIQTGDVASSNGLITKYNRTYSEAGLAQSRLWPKGTLCITIAANIGKTGILTFDSCFPDSIVGFVPRENVDVEYVHQWFCIIRDNLENKAPYSAQKNININILSNLLIPLPPVALQKDFAAKVAQIRLIAERQDQAFHLIEYLCQSLNDQAFSGQLTRTWRMKNVREENVIQIASTIRKEEVTEFDQTKIIFYPLIDLLENNLREQNALEFSEEIRISAAKIIQSVIESKDLLRSNLTSAFLSRSKRIINILIDDTLGHDDRINNILSIISELPDNYHPRRGLLLTLSDEQFILYLSTLLFPEDYFTPENLVEDTDLSLISVQQSLELMEAIGLLVHVCLPTKPVAGSTLYIPLYRVHRHKNDDKHYDITAEVLQ